MPASRRLFSLLLIVVSSLFSFAQASKPVAPLPTDSLELATGATMMIDTPENRTLVLGLLERARQNGSELYATGGPAFSLKVSFTVSGEGRYTGSGEMDETHYSRGLWRWSARLGDYTQRRVFQNGIAYDEKTPGPIPLRLQMVREAVLWSMYHVRPGAGMRMASAKWNGMDVMCALLSTSTGFSATPGRRWEESEYCVDTKAGLLRIHSEAPGIYVTYDYSDALHFHERVLARQITIIEDGNPVVQIHVDSIEDPGAPDAGLFVPTKQMMAQGPGIVLRGPIRLTEFAPSSSAYARVVIIHAAIDHEGRVVEAEALQNSDSNLSDAALAVVEHSTYDTPNIGVPLQMEAFIEVVFGGEH